MDLDSGSIARSCNISNKVSAGGGVKGFCWTGIQRESVRKALAIGARSDTVEAGIAGAGGSGGRDYRNRRFSRLRSLNERIPINFMSRISSLCMLVSARSTPFPPAAASA